MRRKVLQDFANVFCQKFIQLPNGYDLATFVHLGSGSYALDILSGTCTRNSAPIAKLHTCDAYKNWLDAQLDKHRIPISQIKSATLEVNVVVSSIKVQESLGHVLASADFDFDCQATIETSEKIYHSESAEKHAWGFDLYYEKLYGSPRELLP